MRKLLLHTAAKPVVFVLCLLPLAWLVYATVANQLGANPAEALIRATGDWTLRALCLVLAITPLRVITATPQLARFRRMLGLFVFFYGVLHLLNPATGEIVGRSKTSGEVRTLRVIDGQLYAATRKGAMSVWQNR